MRKIRSLLALSAAFLVLLSGCDVQKIKDVSQIYLGEEETDVKYHTVGSVTDISMSWWGRDTRHKYMLDGINVFMEKNPDIKVKSSFGEWAGYENIYFTLEKASQESDVMLVTGSWLPVLSSDGKGYYDLESLTDYIDLSGFTEEELTLGRSNGVLNAVPIALNTLTFYYNKRIYDSYNLEIPSTWDDLFAAAKVMKGESYPLFMTDTALWVACVAYTEQATGKSFLSKKNRMNFSEADIKQALEFYKKLVDEQVTPINGKIDITHTGDGLYAGIVGWVSDAEGFCALPNANGDEIVIGKPIILDGAKVTGWYVKPATLYAISDHTENPVESAKLLNFLINDPDMLRLQGIEKGFPISDYAKDVVDVSSMPTQYKAVQAMEENMDLLGKYNSIEEIRELRDAFFESGAKIIYGESDSDTEAEVLYKTFSDVIASTKAK